MTTNEIKAKEIYKMAAVLSEVQMPSSVSLAEWITGHGPPYSEEEQKDITFKANILAKYEENNAN